MGATLNGFFSLFSNNIEYVFLSPSVPTVPPENMFPGKARFASPSREL